MRNRTLIALGGLLFTCLGSCLAYISVPHEPVVNKAALADCVMIGKITAIRTDTVKARLYRWQDAKEKKTGFTIAEVEVMETILGNAKAKKVLIGFISQRRYQPAPRVG